jgi:hypothetical protein
MNLALALVRPGEVIKTAARVPAKLELARQDAKNLPEARPLELLFARMAEKVKKFVVDDKDLFSKRGLAAQAEMIEHYLDTQQYQQALTLAREALVSWMCGVTRCDPLKERKSAEEKLHRLSCALKRKPMQDGTERDLAELWNALGDLRNDVNHAGMRVEPQPAGTVEKNINAYCAAVIRRLRG